MKPQYVSRVGSSKKERPRIRLHGFSGSVDLSCRNQPPYEVKTLRGASKHFVSLRPTRAEITRRAPSNVLGAELSLTVVNNFGAKVIELLYGKETRVRIGQETITLESFDFDYSKKSVKVRIRTEPHAGEAEATVVEYGSEEDIDEDTGTDS